ncbi:hypothetical protein GPECTOR_1g182 [Gonium pectorale]|uniref:SPX domain-containing protein n=1 Tax=Gonium pectorale TaxID=33097 RepID=A0A150H3R3_GONPE|nr:hypothetical protein GPECTOR_1g182 [Gonium pectorale]|eukprot:KXZ56210.1 hypothetical protein GPECTOR_1g182 [Gonium pectorale]
MRQLLRRRQDGGKVPGKALQQLPSGDQPAGDTVVDLADCSTWPQALRRKAAAGGVNGGEDAATGGEQEAEEKGCGGAKRQSTRSPALEELPAQPPPPAAAGAPVTTGSEELHEKGSGGAAGVPAQTATAGQAVPEGEGEHVAAAVAANAGPSSSIDAPGAKDEGKSPRALEPTREAETGRPGSPISSLLRKRWLTPPPQQLAQAAPHPTGSGGIPSASDTATGAGAAAIAPLSGVAESTEGAAPSAVAPATSAATSQGLAGPPPHLPLPPSRSASAEPPPAAATAARSSAAQPAAGSPHWRAIRRAANESLGYCGDHLTKLDDPQWALRYLRHLAKDPEAAISQPTTIRTASARAALMRAREICFRESNLAATGQPGKRCVALLTIVSAWNPPEQDREADKDASATPEAEVPRERAGSQQPSQQRGGEAPAAKPAAAKVQTSRAATAAAAPGRGFSPLAKAQQQSSDAAQRGAGGPMRESSVPASSQLTQEAALKAKESRVASKATTKLTADEELDLGALEYPLRRVVDVSARSTAPAGGPSGAQQVRPLPVRPAPAAGAGVRPGVGVSGSGVQNIVSMVGLKPPASAAGGARLPGMAQAAPSARLAPAGRPPGGGPGAPGVGASQAQQQHQQQAVAQNEGNRLHIWFGKGGPIPTETTMDGVAESVAAHDPTKRPSVHMDFAKRCATLTFHQEGDAQRLRGTLRVNGCALLKLQSMEHVQGPGPGSGVAPAVPPPAPGAGHALAEIEGGERAAAAVEGAAAVGEITAVPAVVPDFAGLAAGAGAHLSSATAPSAAITPCAADDPGAGMSSAAVELPGAVGAGLGGEQAQAAQAGAGAPEPAAALGGSIASGAGPSDAAAAEAGVAGGAAGVVEASPMTRQRNEALVHALVQGLSPELLAELGNVLQFGKVLKVAGENMPSEMHNLFLRYKELKKQIKLIPVGKDAAAGNEKQASVSPDGSSTGSGSTGAAVTATVLSPEEQAFINTLNEDLARFNRYFIEKEEEAVIRLQALCDELVVAAAEAGLQLPPGLVNAGLSDAEEGPAAATGTRAAAAAGASASAAAPAAGPRPEAADVGAEAEPAAAREPRQREPVQAQAAVPAGERLQPEPGEGADEPQRGAGASASHHHHHHHHRFQPLHAVKSRLVQFHGEMVLLLHWSLLNYAAVVKILKKHDKRTGVLLRAPYLANVLQQPFSSTTIMSRLAKKAEELVVATTQLAPAAGVPLPLRPAGEASAAAGAAVAAQDSRAATTATATVLAAGGGADGGVAAESIRHAGGAAAVGPAGREAPSASEMSSRTLAGAEREASYAGAPGLATEPLVGSTMHALETWANLRKNAITPSTVLAADGAQPASKRKAEAETPEPDASAQPPASKAAKPDPSIDPQ